MLKKIMGLLAQSDTVIRVAAAAGVTSSPVTGNPDNQVLSVTWPTGGTLFTEEGLSQAKVNKGANSLEALDFEGDLVSMQLVTAGQVVNLSEALDPVSGEEGTAFLVIQEGGSSTELYVHAHATREAAEADRESCATEGAYRTSKVIDVPDSLVQHPKFFDFAEALLRGTLTLDYPGEAE